MPRFTARWLLNRLDVIRIISSIKLAETMISPLVTDSESFFFYCTQRIQIHIGVQETERNLVKS